ncbi:hypothetical protein BWQ96_09746 [Gracilariopsis chorda]|uniref:LTD domain-containing protein n=1 Tax=Gracilariopsis chorda TaxID=448386 RepID=A0A2V3IES8_9FLOR|nr:hypothetical protein BWQ96_09746 [Gracilariopsis chorda]|eukprot:PXF40551.1 hypothetical protein BWQ96_09746 [Gracilariopsis chorda]
MAFHLIVSATIPLFLLLTTKTHSQFINEIHYDNEGLDVNEAVEIAAPAGTDLSGWSLQFYNGNGGSLYQKVSLFGVTPSQINGWGFRTFAISSIQNGPDAIALVNDAGSLVEFLSYEGVVTGVAGVADGVRSTDISVAESSSTSTNSSLQRVGTGNSAPDFSWTGPIQSSFGDVNDGQTFTALPPCPTTFVNEMRLEGIDAKLNETVEIAALAATDLSGWQLALYHGRDGKRYKTVSLFGVVSDESHGWGTLEFDVSPVLTGELIGVALVDDAGGVLQFLSAGGTLTAVDGPAQGKRSVDVGVEESGSPPSTHSLQLVGDGNNACDYRWTGPAPSSFGSVNIGQRFTTTASSGDSSGEGGGGRGVVEGNAEQVQKVSIGAIQGESHISPLDGERVNVQGIVTAVGSRGFYIQDGIGDGNDATSDAIWVFSRSRAAVNVGDEVSVIGMVTEFFQGGQGTNRLSLTELSEPSFEVLSSNNELPAVVVLGVDGRQPPSESIDAKPTEFDVVNDGLDFYESLEGMRVRVKNAVVISPKSRFGAIWVVGDGGVGATGLNERGALTIAQNDFNPSASKSTMIMEFWAGLLHQM